MATSSSLVKKIEDNFLACAICFEQLSDPIGLPCLHGFCYECLDNWYKTCKDKSHVICPACKEPAPVPEGGIRGFPGHFLVKSLKETIDMEKQAKKKVSCSICEKTATTHCLDCKDYLCNDCLDSHKAFRSMKDHKIATVEELQSGKVTRESRFCKIHGELVRYYCETEEKQVCPDCISLKTCPMEHERITLKDAAKKQTTSLEELTEKCKATNIKIHDAVQSTKKALQDLTKAEHGAKASLVHVKKNCSKQLEQIFKKHQNEIEQLVKEREKRIGDTLKALEERSKMVQKTCNHVSQCITSETEFEITHKYALMSNALRIASQLEPEPADVALGYIKFEAANPVIQPIGQLLKQTQWELVRKFSVDTELDELWHFDINKKNGDFAISDKKGSIKVFSHCGKAKKTLKESGNNNISVTPDGRYVTFDNTKITHYNIDGTQLSTTSYGIDSQRSPCASTTNSTGKIVLGWEDNFISVHYAEGSLISQFPTQVKPYRLAVTSKGEIVASFWDASLKLMDYSGGNVRVIQAPPQVSKWDPGNICCSPHNEIFVINEGGDGCIYRFTADGKYLGLVTTDTVKARGMALSEDCTELFVTEAKSKLVKVFQRQ